MEAPIALIDATAVPADRGGVGRYVDGVIAAFDAPVAIACQARDADFYRTLAPFATVLPQSPRIESVPLRFLWEQFVLPGVARRAGARVIHSPHYTLPLFSTRPRVVTFHDATFFSDPGLHTKLKRAFFAVWIRISARLAKAVIVPSKATASELERYVRHRGGYDVAYHGVDALTFHAPSSDDSAEARRRLGLEGRRWIAFLGTIEPRKNVPALIAGYRLLVERWQERWGEIPLLALAGGRGWETNLQSELDLVRPPAEVRELGFIDLAFMRGFLGDADVVVYPSLGEGFGLPVLEGMACGAPVLTTRRLALPEVGGDAVAYSDVDAESIAAALATLLADPEATAVLAERGLMRSRAFTWRASALTHESVYHRVAAGKG